MEKCHARDLGATLLDTGGYFKSRMISGLTVSSRSVWRLRMFAAALAVVGQLGIFGGYVSLARDESSTVSHTEQGGVDSHHGHNDATCAACTALSFQATVNPTAPPQSTVKLSHFILAHGSTSRASTRYLLPNSCRAPPREA